MFAALLLTPQVSSAALITVSGRSLASVLGFHVVFDANLGPLGIGVTTGSSLVVDTNKTYNVMGKVGGINIKIGTVRWIGTSLVNTAIFIPLL